jgi:transcriptional regulator with XRE-family HTH domain
MAVTTMKYPEFAKLLDQRMKARRMSGSDVARAMWGTTKDGRGYTVAQNRDRITEYLKGVSFPNPENLPKLAAAIDVSAEELARTVGRSATTIIPYGRAAAHELQVNYSLGTPGLSYLVCKQTLPTEITQQIVALILQGQKLLAEMSNEEK